MQAYIHKTFASRNSTTLYNFLNMISRTKTRFVRSKLDQEWREQRGLTQNPNKFGPLTNLPDYSFLDGRPTPLGMRQQERIMMQQEIAKKIVSLTSEVDFAVERFNRIKKKEEEEREAVIRNKLKPKGNSKNE